MQALNAMQVSEEESQAMLHLHEKYVCALAVLRVQRFNMVGQLRAAYQQTAEEWLQVLSRLHLQHKSFLGAAAAIETLYTWLRKESELFCDLFLSVVLNVRPLHPPLKSTPSPRS